MLWWAFLVISVISNVESHGGHHYARGSHSNMPMHKKHEHYRPNLPEPEDEIHVPDYALFQDKQLLHDTEHIKEDLIDILPNVDLDKLSETELEFHYFKLHDYDQNNKLDGLEILSAIMHILPSIDSELENDDEKTDPAAYTRKRMAAQERRMRETNYQFAPTIDKLLKDDDKDKDGFLSYAEYSLSKRQNGIRLQV